MNAGSRPKNDFSPIGKIVPAFMIVHDDGWIIQKSCTRIITLDPSY